MTRSSQFNRKAGAEFDDHKDPSSLSEGEAAILSHKNSRGYGADAFLFLLGIRPPADPKGLPFGTIQEKN